MTNKINSNHPLYNADPIDSTESKSKIENQKKDSTKGIRPEIEAENSREKRRKSELKATPVKLTEKNLEEDLYDLDLQIVDISSQAIPSDTVQSEWPRCSKNCQTIRGATCQNCDTQQAKYTCIRC